MTEKKQVPEEAVMTKDEINQELERLIRDNESFARLRAEFPYLGKVLFGIAERSASPTAAGQAVDRLAGDLKIWTVKTAQLLRDGKTDLAHKVTDIMVDRDRPLPWEPLPSIKLVPTTLVMLEPAKTIFFIRFVQRGEFYRLATIDAQRQESADQLVKTFTKMFPHWLEIYRELQNRRDKTKFWDYFLGQVYLSCVVRPHWSSLKKLAKASACPFEIKTAQSFDMNVRLRYERGDEAVFPAEWRRMIHGRSFGRDLAWKMAGALALTVQLEQKDVLCCFSRAEQKRIATWQFRLPMARPYENTDHHITLAPEAFQEKLSENARQLTSSSVSHGYIAVLKFLCIYPKYLTDEVIAQLVFLDRYF